jgi:hypothetical protein
MAEEIIWRLILLALSVLTAGISLWTRAAVAELRAQLGNEQEARCARCRKEFVQQGQFEQLDRRVEVMEDAHG